jgi:hypothetical protein
MSSSTVATAIGDHLLRLNPAHALGTNLHEILAAAVCRSSAVEIIDKAGEGVRALRLGRHPHPKT